MYTPPPRFSIIGIALALIVFFATLFIHASENTAVNNTKFEVKNNQWNINFDNVPNLGGVVTQYKGGGITNVFTTIWSTSINQGSSRTNVAFNPLSNNPSGTYYFRLAVTQCFADGTCSVMQWACNSYPTQTVCTSDGWARTSHDFD